LPFIALIAELNMNQTAIPTPATTATGAPVIAKAVIVMAAGTIARSGGGGGGGGGEESP